MSVGFEIHHPADLQGKGVFFYSGDPVTPKLYAAIGGITPKQLSINEVLPRSPAAPSTSWRRPRIGAEQLQWGSRITDMNTETLAYVIGARPMQQYRYRYELRHQEETIATGHLTREHQLEVGDHIEISGSLGIVRVVEPPNSANTNSGS